MSHENSPKERAEPLGEGMSSGGGSAPNQAALLAKKQALLAMLLEEEGMEIQPSLGIQRRANVHEFPLSFAQQRLWFLDQFEPGNHYNDCFNLRFKGCLDVAALGASVDEIVRRHEAMRACFKTDDGQPVQEISPPVSTTLSLIDLTHLAEGPREAEAAKLAIKESLQIFDLRNGPLWRARLLRLDREHHVLVFTLHHVAMDGWSRGVFLSELKALYEAYVAGKKSPLPELAIQYSDYALWQREWLQGELLDKQVHYWKQQLKGAPALLEIAPDRRRPATQSYQGACQPVRISKPLTESLKALAQQEGGTLFMVLLAALQTLASRYTGREDIIIGSPIANRTRAEMENLIGYFLNTLVLRTDLSGDPTFRELLARVKAVTLGAYAHQDLPFEKLIEELQLPRTQSHTPLFQIMFVLQNTPPTIADMGGVAVSPWHIFNGTTKFDLTLNLTEGADGVSGNLEFVQDLYEPATIARLVEHFHTLLEGIVANPNQKISRLPLLPERERRQLLIEWNDTKTEYPKELCVQHLFEAQVTRTPDAVALEYEGQQLSYSELNARANQLAHHLRGLGVKPEVLVAICVERSLEMVIGLLGILKAGGAYVPLDSTYPAERLAFMLQDSQAPVLVSQKHLLAGLPASEAKVVCLDTDWPLISQANAANCDSGVTSQNLAYVIYTSGSTGKPKGALIVHQGLVNYLTWCTQAYEVEKGNGAPVHSSISFDLTITGLFPPLLSGRTVHFVREDQVGVELLSEALSCHTNYSLVKITPAHLELLSQQLPPHAVAGRTRRFIIGGENLLGESLAFWQDHAPDTIHVNEYGPTETVVGCCVYSVPKGQRIVGSVPIGRPIANTQLYVLDKHFQPVPIGVTGELFIGGDGVGRGYLNRPELSAERFIPDPFQTDLKARLYKTGDIARYLPDGNLEFLGRSDHQVKIRGFRIELGEIEAVLRSHPGVREIVVMARQDEPGEKKLVAYLAPAQEPAPTITELREHIKQKLPDYMVPSAFVVLPVLPLTPNGKVDTKALAAPDQARPDLERTFTGPRNPVEEKLSEIWAEVLRLERVGIHDNFFELGGDSILSIQIISRSNQAGLRLTPKQLFQNQTIAELAAVAGTAAVVQSEQNVVSGEVILTPIQQWFFEHNFAEPHHWNQVVLLEVRQNLEPALLEKAIAGLVAHHDALRLRFVPEASGWKQHNAAADKLAKLRCIDLADKSEAELDLAFAKAATEIQTSLNLAQGPLIQAALFDLGLLKPSRLFLAIHHLAVDGVSQRILLEDLQTAYQQLSRGQSIKLPAKTTSFKEWAQRLTEHSQTPVLQSELDYWLSVGNTKAVPLPLDFANGANTEESMQTVSLSLSSGETRSLLQEVPQAYSTQINDVLLTALGLAFSKWTGERSVSLRLEGHGREELFDGVDLSRTVGWFTGIFPVALEWGESSQPDELLKSIKEQLRRIPNRGIGFGLLRYLSKNPDVVAKLAALPQPGVVFNYLGQFDQALVEGSPFNLLRANCGPSHSPRAQRSGVLEIDSYVVAGCLHMEWRYSSNIHRRESIQKVAHDFNDALRVLIRHCLSAEAGGKTPSDFPLAKLTQPELDRLLASHPEIEDVYTLSPMQKLFHTLASGQPEIGFEQFHFTFRGHVDVAAFQQAWQKVLNRHGILRTAFASEGLDEPHQFVNRTVDLVVEQQDWRNISPAEQQTRLESFLKADHQRGVDFSRAPLMRLTLLQTAEDTVEFVWSHHHILLDGWSWPLLFKEVIAFYDALRQGQKISLEPSRQYRDYIGWLQRQDLSAAKTYWTRTLQGFTTPTTLHGGRKIESAGVEGISYHDCPTQLSVASTSALQALVKEQQLTLNVLIEAAWALVLSRNSGSSDVMFGSTVAGRPAELPGVESMIGLFISNLPRRVRITNEETLLPWLKRLQEEQVELRDYEYTPLLQIQEWSEVPWRSRLFESLILLQNYRRDAVSTERFGNLEIVQLQAPVRTNYPLTLMAVPGSELSLQLICDGRYFDAAAAEKYIQQLKSVLENIAGKPSQRISEILNALPLPVVSSHAIVSQSSAVELNGQRTIVAPRDTLELQISKIWERVLGIQPIGVTDNFFDLGGHSLPAVRLFQEIKKAYKKNLPLATLIQAPTVERLANILREDGWSAPWSSLVPIQPKGSKPPFYCVHGAGGNVVEYLDIARYLGTDQPLYGIQAQGLDGTRLIHKSTEEMAAYYIQEICSFQPEGPYYIGGSSFGGLVAFEIAQQLQARGQRVAVLALFDTHGPGYPKFLPTHSRLRQRLGHYSQVVGLHWSNIRLLESEKRWAYFKEKGLKMKRVLRRKFYYAKWKLTGKIQHALLPKDLKTVREISDLANDSYIPKPYNGPVTLFRATEQPKGIYPERALGWAQVATGGLQIVDIPGYHGAIVRDPRARILCEHLSALLEKVQREESGKKVG